MEKGREKIRTAEQEEMFRFICVILIVILCVAGVYVLTRAFVTKDLFGKEETKEAVAGTVNYEVAIVGQILNRPYDSYYVFVYNTTGDNASNMSTIISSYKNKTGDKLHVYTVDLNNKLNAEYYDASKENVEAKDVDSFKFGDKTLLKIKDGKVDKYITDLEKMKKELGV